MDVNSLEMNLLVTLLVAVLVFLLPWSDRRICRHLRLSLDGGLSENPNADRLLRLRRLLLIIGLTLYLLLFAWLVFFSRDTSGSYDVHVAPLEDVKNAFSTPTGFTGWFQTLFTEGFASAFSQISIVRPEDLSQFYLNMMLFVPMGYLLPYVFRWFRAQVNTRPVLFCLLLSFLVENLQLMTQRGLYDFDDIVSNTLGGWIGQLLYISVGYVVTHPNWRKDLREHNRWLRKARSSTLFPYTRKSGMFRATLRGTNQAEICDFYENRLGFRLRQQLIRRESGDTVLLFEMGDIQVQIICSFRESVPEQQFLTLFATHLPAVRYRLEANGIVPGDYRRDPSTGRRLLRFSGPDNTRVEIMETD